MARRPLLTAGFGLALAAGLAVAGVLLTAPKAPPATETPVLALVPARFADLPGWTDDRAEEAWPAFRLSCERLLKRKPETSLGLAGTVADWVPACTEALALALAAPDTATVRDFFEDRFRPVQALNGTAAQGLFTGYYEPELAGSPTADETNRTPLYRRPGDLVQVDLGDFRDELKGQRIAGRVRDGRLKPFEDREAITGGALAGQGLELVWVASPVEAFFLEIQGSGRVRLPDGRLLRVGFDGQNGHPYVALGKVMLADGLLEKGRVTMQSIKAWLNAHPAQAAALMNRNPSYVFFRDLGEGPGPLGAQGVALTAGRSLAVDRKFFPLGVPVFLDASLPPPAEGEAAPAFRRLMVAQDTGGAIRGPVRGDVFFGAGAEAERLAGAMKQQGRWWWLLPAPVAAALDAGPPEAGKRP
ncbi:murein transglycosylase A [Zavarzinia compransoris]|uniref:peptidoglycan lytic exotransglycosylase n=1 Tax=Zavarzinia compransoris TaxID=1264899 RepID=A0A317E0F8_9PROT|nr:MltA domain-containing protein [Zavarzinia compransoris]PWR20557.1 murein transglycosylase [Zavarzinia compransoris]TDP43797.1 membrane-bound lytic murein transglycosylase A [Zavarzinia compransoris]